MIDLHTHSVFSDGVLIPAELIRRAESKGLKGIAITDHGDMSNMDFIIPRIKHIADQLNGVTDIGIIPGIEVTHVPPSLISDAVRRARQLGAKIVVVHGETLVEPVAPGTNRAALESDIDILAHPGLITEEEALLAKVNNICLEITARKGHCLANGWVARVAQKTGAKMVVNTDTHEPGDLIDHQQARRVVMGAGLSASDFEAMQAIAAQFFE